MYVCRTKTTDAKRKAVRNIHELNESSGNNHEMNENSDTSEDDDYSEAFALMYTTDHKYVNFNRNDSSKTTKLKVNNTNINFIIDSGNSINVIEKTSFRKLNLGNKVELQRSKQKIYPYGTTEPLFMLGYFDTTLKNKNVIVRARIHVVDSNDARNLLGLETSKELHPRPQRNLKKIGLAPISRESFT